MHDVVVWVRRHLLRRQLLRALFCLRCRVRVTVAIGFNVSFRVRVSYRVKSRAEVRHSISVRV